MFTILDIGINEIIIIIIIGLLLIIINNILMYSERSLTIGSGSEYECGFQEFESTKKQYYLKYYVIAIMFLIFDIETLFLYPLLSSYSFWSLFPYLNFLIFTFIIWILLLGLIYEKFKKLL